MRNLLSTAIASLALATLLVGSASAASMATQPTSVNSAEQATLDRDAAQHWTRRGGEGVIISNSDSSASNDRIAQSAAAEESHPWLHRSPAGEVVSKAGPADQQTGEQSLRD